MIMDCIDRSLIQETQAGLPFVKAPYKEIGNRIGLSEEEVLARLSVLQNKGIIRRIGIAPNHYALGMTANGMSVWDVKDEKVSKLGKIVGSLDFVTHCYLRPRKLPLWPYNLFAMVHGRNRDEVENKRLKIAQILGEAAEKSDILFSTRILKKTGLRLTNKGAQ